MKTASAGPCCALWLVGAIACGPTPENSGEVPEAVAFDANDGGADSTGGLVPSERSPNDTAPTREPTQPEPFPDLDEETVLRTYELWIVNRRRMQLIIYASAGAERVSLDTVPGRDSVKVNVRVRARSLSLDAEDEEGRSIDSAELELAPASSNRWEIPEPGGR